MQLGAFGQTLGGRQGDAPDRLGIQVGQHFNNHTFSLISLQQGIKRGKAFWKEDVDHAAADADHRSLVLCL
jgi:hypothetical protein